tara:strand:+ start:1426 stop:1623 length:198 start_codon:yes stop_codon:yes gene_type:complete
MENYVAVCESKAGLIVEYVFPSQSFHHCRVQAVEHGLFGDKLLRIERISADDEGRKYIEGQKAAT